ncbi:MAG: hypothetical protein LUQ18_08445 [Methylococcaceae bacterium]|nr:hypothetical protein [Methylococcaceae bacterium]
MIVFIIATSVLKRGLAVNGADKSKIRQFYCLIGKLALSHSLRFSASINTPKTSL